MITVELYCRTCQDNLKAEVTVKPYFYPGHIDVEVIAQCLRCEELKVIHNQSAYLDYTLNIEEKE